MSSPKSTQVKESPEVLPYDEGQKKIMAQWLASHPAFKATTEHLGNNAATLSSDQIDTILAIRKKIASAEQFHG